METACTSGSNRTGASHGVSGTSALLVTGHEWASAAIQKTAAHLPAKKQPTYERLSVAVPTLLNKSARHTALQSSAHDLHTQTRFDVFESHLNSIRSWRGNSAERTPSYSGATIRLSAMTPSGMVLFDPSVCRKHETMHFLLKHEEDVVVAHSTALSRGPVELMNEVEMNGINAVQRFIFFTFCKLVSKNRQAISQPTLCFVQPFPDLVLFSI